MISAILSCVIFGFDAGIISACQLTLTAYNRPLWPPSVVIFLGNFDRFAVFEPFRMLQLVSLFRDLVSLFRGFSPLLLYHENAIKPLILLRNRRFYPLNCSLYSTLRFCIIPTDPLPTLQTVDSVKKSPFLNLFECYSWSAFSGIWSAFSGAFRPYFCITKTL